MKMKIDIKGVIIPNGDKWIYDWFEIDAVCPRDVLSGIEKADGEPLDVYINSEGGDVFAGSEIYSALREYGGVVTIHVVGFAASAASVIMCARDCDITPTGLVMIHNVSGGARGDYHVMDKESDILQTANDALSEAYCLKTGKSKSEILKLMDNEAWLTAKEAVEFGLVDRVTGLQLTAAGSCFSSKSMTSINGGVLPSQVYFSSKSIPRATIEKMKNLIKPPESVTLFEEKHDSGVSTDDISAKKRIAEARLNLLKLGGKTG